MKCENIDIKKFQQFCKIIKKIQPCKFNNTVLIKKEMTTKDYLQLKDNRYKSLIQDLNCAVRPDTVKLEDCKGREDFFWNQIIDVSYKVLQKSNINRIANFLSKIFNDIDVMDVLKNNDGFTNLCKYFSKPLNFKTLNSKTISINVNGNRLQILFPNDNFKYETNYNSI